MSEDLRGYSLLLVSHHVLNHTTLAQREGAELSASVLDWAHANGHGVYQLPAPLYYFERAEDRGTDVARKRLEDRAALDFVASQLRVYLDNGYSLEGGVMLAEDSDEPREQDWVVDLTDALEAIGVTGLPLWSVSREPGAPFSPRMPFAG